MARQRVAAIAIGWGKFEAAGAWLEVQWACRLPFAAGAAGQDGSVSEGVSSRPAPHVLGSVREHALLGGIEWSRDSAKPSRALGCCSVQIGETIGPGVVHC